MKYSPGNSPDFNLRIHYAFEELKRVGRIDKLPEPLRVAVLVVNAQGIIDNGGFQYFFEGDFPQRPSYTMFVQAYRAIGAVDEAELIAKAVALFPFADPHLDVKRRNAFLNRFRRGGTHVPESPFEPLTNELCGNEKVWTLLEQYAALHHRLFSRQGGV